MKYVLTYGLNRIFSEDSMCSTVYLGWGECNTFFYSTGAGVKLGVGTIL